MGVEVEQEPLASGAVVGEADVEELVLLENQGALLPGRIDIITSALTVVWISKILVLDLRTSVFVFLYPSSWI